MALHKPEHPQLTTEALVSWLRKQDPDQEYIWSDPAFCMMGKYLSDHNSSWGAVGYSEMPSYYEIASPKPWTFGAALKRAEALKALPPPDDADRWQHAPGTTLPEMITDPIPLAELELPPLKALPAPV